MKSSFSEKELGFLSLTTKKILFWVWGSPFKQLQATTSTRITSPLHEVQVMCGIHCIDVKRIKNSVDIEPSNGVDLIIPITIINFKK